ncbi:GNAT family N-acetyltransferase [Marinilactibacillus sp. Marseille-P9653]|uniref:GNAT family N-acetyltransferase n=1 Tax=Marinilactibacillus sp. Marseille-P9653 TaxID=2866583 RepID=UPI001CE3CA8D|nr:GNAT family N-acetyltransferase [Marinilactibacillus sp. Marseille-P9653]
MELRKLKVTDEIAYINYIKTWGNEKIVPTSSDHGEKTYQDFLQKLMQAEKGTEQGVPSETYFLFLEEQEIAGAINCRYQLNDQLKHIGGHIGYGISPVHRRKGLAHLILGKTLPLFKEKGIERVLLTADDDNLGSVRTIKNHQGQKISSDIKDEKMFSRYWINV